jgi:hypothetical protein
MGDVLHLLHLVFGGLSGGEDDWKLGALIRTAEVMNSGMARVETAERAKDMGIEALDELVAYADGVSMLSSE